jgi:hypothetical protein
MLEYIRQQRPDTKWVVHLLTNVREARYGLDIGKNMSWLGFLRPSLEHHDVRPGSERSRDCLCRHHSIHQLKQRKLCFSKYEQHFSYIKDLRSYSHSYLCSKCDRLWKHVGKLHRHERTCTGDVIYKYPGGVYHTTQTVCSNSWCRRTCRENVVPTELRCHQLLFLVSHTHTRSS